MPAIESTVVSAKFAAILTAKRAAKLPAYYAAVMSAIESTDSSANIAT
jgi:hypothetical protein